LRRLLPEIEFDRKLDCRSCAFLATFRRKIDAFDIVVNSARQSKTRQDHRRG
jgi:hypothetical protein